MDLALGIGREPVWLERPGCDGSGFEGAPDPRGLCATRLLGTFHLVTMPQAVRRALVQAAEFAGLEIGRIVPGLIAQAQAAGEACGPGRTLLLDLGGGVTDLGLFAGGRLQAMRTIDWGGTKFAASLAGALRLTAEQGMALSLEGVSSRRAEVRQALEAQVHRVGEAARALLAGAPAPAGSSGGPGPAPDAVLAAGRACLIDGLLEALEHALGLPVGVARSAATQSLGDLARQLAFSPVLGLREWAARDPALVPRRRPRRVGRLLDRTRELLLEYF
jgi:cell division protein FtsA